MGSGAATLYSRAVVSASGVFDALSRLGSEAYHRNDEFYKTSDTSTKHRVGRRVDRRRRAFFESNAILTPAARDRLASRHRVGFRSTNVTSD